jgi:hypothetical protein
MPGYWNRDLKDQPFTCWHSDCFPVRLPEWWELSNTKAVSAPAHVLDVHAKPRDEFTADEWEDAMGRATHKMTPDGYAWTNTLLGAACAACGEPA